MSTIFDEAEELKVREIVRLTLDEANLPKARRDAIEQHIATCEVAQTVKNAKWWTAGLVAGVTAIIQVIRWVATK